MLILNLRPIFEARHIERPYTFLVKAGFTSITAHNLLNNKSSSIRFDHIERLCRILICEPSDLFVYYPSKNEHLPTDHPLTTLRQLESDITIHETLSHLPYRKLKEMTKNILTIQTNRNDVEKDDVS